MYRRTAHSKFGLDGIRNTAKCPECNNTRLMVQRGSLLCTNCGEKIGQIGKTNKYGAKRTKMNGQIYDSGFEASVAAELEIQKRAGIIKDFDTQYRVEGWVYDENGNQAFKFRHKVDFRVHNLDGSYLLKEAKGIETDDYKWRRKLLENVWLPAHPDHEYEVVYQNKPPRRTKSAARAQA